ncbi:histidine kinase [Haloferax namakaokahaiae]|uniref:Histidine kinase n=1 Tax=Haloferax namakaokahaiae TaxID=1748331 RepID=A0ABD5ZC79_9EURY
MSETTAEVTPQVLVYGVPPSGAWGVDSDVDVWYTSSSHELVQALRRQVPQLLLCLHAPPKYDGIEAVRAVRRLDPGAPVVLATHHRDTMTNLQAAQSTVTWSVELSTDEPVSDGLFDVVTDASEWFESQTA